MKRLVAFVVTIITAVCLGACSAVGKNETTKPNGLDSRFQAAVSVELDELDAEGTIKRFGDGMWEIEFASPNTLSGVKLSFNEGNVSASYKGLNFSVPQSALPVKAMMLNLISAVDDLAKNEELSGEEADGMLKISGSLDGGEYTLTVDKNGSISSFEMPNNKLKITFSEVTMLGEESASEASTTAAPTEAGVTAAPTTGAVTTAPAA
ncbi:MAG: hypothetical protein IJX77_01075 [Ruminococcus sp.]|nr:hypothetical protein [Ruminococcus sp.]